MCSTAIGSSDSSSTKYTSRLVYPIPRKMLYFETQNLCLITDKGAMQSICYCIPDFKKMESVTSVGAESISTEDLL